MARILDRQKAIEFRKQGKTYSEIKSLLDVSKSTLSNWLSKYSFTDDQLKVLEKNIEQKRYISIEKIRNTKKRKRRERLKKMEVEVEKKIFPLTKKELYLAGLFLYLGEGVKGMRTQISLNNTNPKIVKFYCYWLVKSLKIPKEKIKVNVHLYSDMDIEKVLNYWSRELNIPRNQFAKPYIKESVRKGISHKGYGWGTCGLYVFNTRLKEKIELEMKTILHRYSRKIDDRLV